MSWRGTSTGITAAKSGHDVVMTPNEYCYFDYDQGIIDDPVKYPWNWTALLPLAKVYSFDPLKGIPSEHRWHILGAQGNNWSEMTCSEQELQWKIWPRAAALAEVLWTGPKNCDFKDFIKRMNYCRDALVQEGINVAPLQTRENRSLKSELARETTKNGEIVRYTCGTNVSILVLEKGVLVLSASGQPPRRFLHDDFAEVEMISVGGGSYFATARRPNSDIVVTVLFDEERIVAKDRWDEKKE